MNPQRLNGYSYVLNDPINYVDPDGADPVALFRVDVYAYYDREPEGSFRGGAGGGAGGASFDLAEVVNDLDPFAGSGGGGGGADPKGFAVLAPHAEGTKIIEAVSKLIKGLAKLKDKPGCADFMSRVFSRLDFIVYDKNDEGGSLATTSPDGTTVTIYDRVGQMRRDPDDLALTIAHEFYHVTQIVAGVFGGSSWMSGPNEVYAFRFELLIAELLGAPDYRISGIKDQIRTLGGSNAPQTALEDCMPKGGATP